MERCLKQEQGYAPIPLAAQCLGRHATGGMPADRNCPHVRCCKRWDVKPLLNTVNGACNPAPLPNSTRAPVFHCGRSLTTEKSTHVHTRRIAAFVALGPPPHQVGHAPGCGLRPPGAGPLAPLMSVNLHDPAC